MFGEPHGLPLSQMPHYRATTRATLLVQKALHGDRAAPFHVFNALLMGVAALGAYAVLRHRRFRLPALAAALGAAAFALHPAASSTVHPISSGRETLLPVACALFALAAWLRGGLVGRALGVAGFAAALLGKEQGLVLLPIFVLADALALTPDAPGRSLRAWALRVVPLLAVVAGYLTLRGAVFAGRPEPPLGPLLLEHWRTTWWGPLSALAYAIQTWLAPTARIVYEPDLSAWLSPPRLVLALGGFAALAVAAWRLPREDRAPVAFWLLFVPAGMGMTLRLLPQEAPYAERFLLLSSLGLFALIATLGARAAERWPARRRALVGAALAGLVALAGLSLVRGRDFRDDLAFTRRWVETSPQRGNAHYCLGTALARSGDVPAALASLREAARLEPALAAAHYNLGVLLARQGRRAEARDAFEAALRAHPGDAAARDALEELRRN